MKRNLSFIAIALLVASCVTQEVVQTGDGTVSSVTKTSPDYDTWFTGERLRMDLTLAGNKDEQKVYLKELHREAQWGGSPNSLIDDSGYGQYFIEAFAGDTLVYSKGFSTLFEEWRTTPQAERLSVSAGQSLWMPFPKDTVHLVLYQRERATGKFDPLFEFDVDPSDRHIVPGPDNDFRVSVLRYSGDPAHKVDLVFAGEGYTQDRIQKLRTDARRMMDYLFSMEPYASRADDFNVWLVESVSKESGVDIPQFGQWRDTVMDSMFDTFYTDRYLTIMDHTKIASVVSGSVFDTVFVIADEVKYGGGGFYNSYAMGTSDHPLSMVVMVHEFGHSFAGLGDEYYDSSVAYEDYYPAGVEPWEPNITTRVDFSSKWEDMLEEGIPVPTPDDSAYAGHVGLFEGAGYMAHGCWRPYYECRMLNNTAPGFCPVCRRAINRMIDYYVR